MPILSFEFILFLVIVVPFALKTAKHFHVVLLLAASYLFYAFSSVPFLLLLILFTGVDYILARWMRQSVSQRARKIALAASLVLNLGVLAFFKYIEAVGGLSNGDGLLGSFGLSEPVLPLGISFYTFAKLGYVLDVYRRSTTPEQNFAVFALFVSFFPTVSSGPIERANHLLPQLNRDIPFDEARIVSGLRRILIGVFKKVVIADRLALYVNEVYSLPDQQPGPALIVATIFLSFQIYADFSAYTDIAIGIARTLGIELFENFRQPYFATSIHDFWRRWHMSLTNWIRDFMFIPLSRFLLKKSSEQLSPRMVQTIAYFAIMITIGLWHGFQWTFIVWGVLHGTYMAVEMRLPMRHRRPPITVIESLIRIGVTFALVTVAWVLFRANSLSDAWYVLTHLVDFQGSLTEGLSVVNNTDPVILSILQAVGFGAVSTSTGKALFFVTTLALIGVLILLDWLDRLQGLDRIIARSPIVLRWAYYYSVTASILLLGIWGQQEFIYFKF